MTWKIYQRRKRFWRRIALRGEQYDGSRWVLKGTYAREQDFQKAWASIQKKGPTILQYKFEVSD